MQRAFARTTTGRVLRLVNDDAIVEQGMLRPGNVSSGGAGSAFAPNVARANAEAAMISDDDARWVFAQQVRDSLDGGRAAILGPQRRRELVARAIKRGLRPFDANLVIAIVQDEVRSGPDVSTGTFGPPPRALGMVRTPESPVGTARIFAVCMVTLLLAAALVAMLIAWITG